MSRPSLSEPTERLPIDSQRTLPEACEEILKTVEKIRGQVGAVIAVENPPVAPGWGWTAFVRLLESLGFVVAAPVENNPHGLFVAEVENDGTFKGHRVPEEKPTSLRITYLGRTLTTRPSELPRHGEKGLNYMHPHVMAILQENNDGQGWIPVITPSGELGLKISNTTAIQYAQSGFEGAVAMGKTAESEVAESERTEAEPLEVSFVNGEVTIFRLEENAKRFAKSAESLGMPPLDIELFKQTFLEVVKYNARYIPMDNPNAKLYIRPCMFGCEGGAGAARAKRYVCTFEVFPYGDYLAGRDSAITARAIKGKHRPQSGGEKVASNYAPGFKLKEWLRNESQHPAVDYLSFDENGNAEEFSSCSCFCLVKGEDGALKLWTPFVAGEEEESRKFHQNGDYTMVMEQFDSYRLEQKRHSLPSITRKSIIEIAGTLGIPVEKRDISFEQLSTDKNIVGVFTTGTAAGITRVGALQFVQNEENDDPSIREFIDPPAQEFIKKLYDILTAVRSGNVKNIPELDETKREALQALTEGWITKVKIGDDKSGISLES